MPKLGLYTHKLKDQLEFTYIQIQNTALVIHTQAQSVNLPPPTYTHTQARPNLTLHTHKPNLNA